MRCWDQRFAAIVCCLLAPVLCQAEEPGWLWRASAASTITGVSLDWASSVGKRELNPLLRGADGRLSHTRMAAWHVGPAVGGVAMQYLLAKRGKRIPKWVIVANFAAGGAMTLVAARNFRIAR